ncbi:Protein DETOXIFICATION [Rhynchospora pubera]|uniref:Protein DETOXIFICATION n=1 Tax=Rhynchospora pubera TaxID=906938 RepID=A0AAV8GJI8_9POAL|nr:Protein DETOXIFICATION [Rhynchospora pubera]
MRRALPLLLGMASALETLCGQSYGSEQYHMLGIYLQQSWIILLATAIITLPLFLFTSPLMRLLGQDPLISDVAGLISLWYISVVFSNVFSFTFQLYLQSQSKNSIISYFFFDIHHPACSSLVGIGDQTWKGFTRSAFSDLWPIVKLSLSSGAMICLELWYESILVLMTGYMENAEVALNALTICFNISVLEIMISLGFLAATGIDRDLSSK